jgi:corrinoid protein of di/trimethylamine methyltransferase
MRVPTAPEMAQAVIDGDVPRARALATALVDGGGDLVTAVEQGFAAGIRKVGDLWQEGEYFLPELVQGAEAMKAAMAVIQPALHRQHADRKPRSRVVIGTVQGDLHDIGKTLVATLLSANGFEVHDLGADVPIERFVEKAREVEARIIAASALLTTTMSAQKVLVDAVAAAGLAGSVRILVGGSATTPAWATEIGAVHAENAVRAVAVATALSGEPLR